MTEAKNKQNAMTVYHAYWDSYLKGDMETMASFIADEFQIIGTTESEVFLDKQETMQFYEATSGQITGKVQFRNRNIRQKQNNGMITVTEFSDAYILADDEWVFYAKFRITSLLEKKEDGWKFVQQHGSIPDARAQEDEQLASGKIRQENLELREALKKRTVELENKNRELEIEASLERVRAIALGMKEPADMLEVCRVISNQLQLLGVKNIRNVQTAIINEEKGTYLNYQYFSAYDIKIIEETKFDQHPKALELAETMKKSADAFFSGSMKGEELVTFREWRKKDNQFPDPLLDETTAVYYNFYSIGPGGLGLTTYNELPEVNLKIFKRFHNVFTLAYRRFIDIEKAEAQAREAQIEASLERVRSLALGMHHSEEVGTVSDGFFAEFNKLTMKILGCSIVVVDEKKDSMELWRARSDVALKPFDKHLFSAAMTTVKNNLPDFFPVFYTAFQEKKDNLMYELSGDERLSFLNTIIEQGNYSDKDKAKLFKSVPDTMVTYYIYFKLGYLALISKERLPDENLAIARRFVDVFGFAYTRFLDIKKAEEQAREAHIETALERVRAKAMAMQRSDELLEASDVMLTQLEKLEINALRIGICTIDSKTGAAEIWSRSEHRGKKQNSILGVVPFGTHSVFDGMVKAWREKRPYFVSERVGDEVKEYYAKLASCLSYPEPKNFNERESVSAFFFKEGSLNIISPEPLSEQECHIMVRFAKAFGQMYTRFQDLLKAEAQNKIIQAENERKTKELEEARQMQLSMLPKDLPQVPNLDIAVYMQTATEVGGDYYDFCFRDDDSLNICLGDATGHGMKAGIMVSSMKSIFTTNAPKMGIEQFFETANTGIKSMNLMHMMMGMVMVNINSNSFKLINAGMPPVFFYSSKSGAIHEIKEHGMPVGAMRLSSYKIVDGSLQKGDVLLLLSDGMPELTNVKNEMFGYNRLLQTFNSVADKEPQKIIDHLKNVAAHWADNKDPDDDVTFVVIKVK